MPCRCTRRPRGPRGPRPRGALPNGANGPSPCHGPCPPSSGLRDLHGPLRAGTRAARPMHSDASRNGSPASLFSSELREGSSAQALDPRGRNLKGTATESGERGSNRGGRCTTGPVRRFLLLRVSRFYGAQCDCWSWFAGEQQAEGLRDVVSGVWPSSFRSSSCAGDGHGEFWEPAESQGRNRNPLSESSELFSFLFFSFL